MKKPIISTPFYEVYHRSNNNYVIWCKRELITIETFVYNDEVEYKPYPYFAENDPQFNLNQIEEVIRQHQPAKQQ